MHSTRATRALRQLAEEDPALAVLALWCQHRDMDEGLAETRGEVIWYGPRFEALSQAEQVGLAAHHVLHVAFRHSARAQAMTDRLGETADQTLFPLAADALINETLQAAGYALPRPAVLATEVVSEALGQTQSVPEVLADWDAERLFLALSDPKPGNGRKPEEHPTEKAKQYASDRGFEGDLKPEGQGEDSDSPSAAEWQDRLARAMAAGRQAGRGIGALGITLADLPEATTPWERVFRALLAEALIQYPRRLHTRPARGWLARDAHARQSGGRPPGFEPGTQAQQHRPRLAVGLDMSSSVGDGLLGRFASELLAIARKSGAEVHLIPFDEIARDPVLLDPRQGAEQLSALRFARDGGTDFGPVLEAAEALSPAMIVMLTDLDAELPPKPRMSVIWACPERPRSPPAYGRVIAMDR